MADLQTKVEERLAKQQENKEFKDIGNRARGTAKEMAAYRVVTSADLSKIEENEIVASNLVKKDRVYPEINVEEEKEKGCSPSAVFLKMKMRELVGGKPPAYATARKVYVAFIEKLVATIAPVKTLTEFETAIKNLFNELPEWFYRLILLDEVYDYYEEKINVQRKEYEAAERLKDELEARWNETLDIEQRQKIRNSINALWSDINEIKNKMKGLRKERTADLNHSFPEDQYNDSDDELNTIWYLRDIVGKRFYNFWNSSFEREDLYREAKKYDAVGADEIAQKVEELNTNSYGKYIAETKERLFQIDNIKSSKELHEILLTVSTIYPVSWYPAGYPGKTKGGYIRYESILALKDKNPEAYFKYAEALKTMYRASVQKRLEGYEQSYKETLATLQPHDDDWSFAEPKKRGEQKKLAELTINEGKPLEFIKRVGGLDTSDITTGAKAEYYLSEILGFKSVTLGTTVKDELASQHIRHFVGAMADLGDILNMDIKALNELNQYNGKGGLQFSVGAFITRFAAFYRSNDVLINLTKKNGQGTISHEYAHYLDNTLAWIDNPGYAVARDHKPNGSFGSESKYMTKKSYYKWLAGDKVKVCHIKNEAVCDKMIRLMNYIYYANADGKDNAVREVRKVFKVDDFNGSFGLPSVSSQLTIEEAFTELFRIRPRMQKVEELTKNTKQVFQWIIKRFGLTEYEVPMLTKYSHYYHNSKSMSSDYWSRDWELFARANETYIFDKLEKAGRANNYLVSGDYFNRPENVYPFGEEREALFTLYDELYATIKKEYGIGDFKPWTDQRTDDYIVLDAKKDDETEIAAVSIDTSEEAQREEALKKIKTFNALLMLINETETNLKRGGRLETIKQTQLLKELKEMMQQGKGYLSIKNFIKDFDVKNVSISEIDEMSEHWTLTINKNGKYEYMQSENFGW